MTEQSSHAAPSVLGPYPPTFKTTGWQGVALLAVAIISIPLYLALIAGLRGLNRLEVSERRRAIRVFGLSTLCGAAGIGLALYLR